MSEQIHEWNSIETVPKDGKTVLLITKEYGEWIYFFGSWSGDRLEVHSYENRLPNSMFSSKYYWLPLPEPPNEVKS